MARYNTNNTTPSSDFRDLHDNSQAYDAFLNSDGATYVDRHGNARKTVAEIQRGNIGGSVNDTVKAYRTQYQPTYASALAALPTFNEGVTVVVFHDEGYNDNCAIYVVDGGVLAIRKVFNPTGIRVNPALRSLEEELTDLTLPVSMYMGAGTKHPSSSIEIDLPKPIVLPRMTTEQYVAITNPIEGMEVYDTTYKGKSVFNGSHWVIHGAAIIDGRHPFNHGDVYDPDTLNIFFGEFELYGCVRGAPAFLDNFCSIKVRRRNPTDIFTWTLLNDEADEAANEPVIEPTDKKIWFFPVNNYTSSPYPALKIVTLSSVVTYSTPTYNFRGYVDLQGYNSSKYTVIPRNLTIEPI